MHKFFGILGGMGPEAGLMFCNEVLSIIKAEKDQDHIPYLLLNYPQIPDRSSYPIGKGEDPSPYLVEGFKILEKSGANFAVVPCNSAHAFLKPIKPHVNIEIVDMISETVHFFDKKYSNLKKKKIFAPQHYSNKSLSRSF